jgi:hypothetical protein
MLYYYVEDYYDGRPMLIDRPFLSEYEAMQSAIANSKTGQYRIVSFPTRDKRKVRALWQMQRMYQ